MPSENNGTLNGVENEGTEVNVNEERLQRIEENQALMQVLGDPDVQKVILAKRQGKQVNVIEGNDAQSRDEEVIPEPEEDPDIKALSDDDPMKKTLRSISELVDRKLQKISEQLKPLDQRLQGIEGLAGNIQKEKVTSQIQEVMKKYPDFKEYREAMVGLSQANPGLGVADLYILAKHQSGKLKIDNGTTQTERPTHQPRRETTRKPNEPVRPQGRKGFNEAIQDALNKLDLTS